MAPTMIVDLRLPDSQELVFSYSEERKSWEWSCKNASLQRYFQARFSSESLTGGVAEGTLMDELSRVILSVYPNATIRIEKDTPGIPLLKDEKGIVL